ncbi:MAG: FAD:protein FMN transferase [Lentisphaerae bacterium]|jgi:thiamine biosynthesis lipoprotein|nr:FAD:protein FMN transferase [Lentisphaerota bacterium]
MPNSSPITNKRLRLLAPLFCVLLIAIIAFFILRRERSVTQSADVAGEAIASPQLMDFTVFNTLCRLSVWSLPPAKSEALFAELNQQLRLLHDCINVYDPKSELSAINRNAASAPVTCSPMLWDILMSAREAWRISDGAFDVTIGPLMQLWGFYGKQQIAPSQDEMQAVRQKVGLDKVRFDEQQHSVAFSVPGMRLDFGGIAKGYALDMAGKILAQHGADIFLLDLGGNIACSATPPPGREAFTIGIRNPHAANTLLGTMSLRGRFIATSGNYERFRFVDGKRVGHIMDPRSGMPCTYLDGVSVVTTSGLLSDVFSTAAFIGRQDLARSLSERFPGSGFIFVSKDQQGKPVLEYIGDLPMLERQNGPGVVD